MSTPPPTTTMERTSERSNTQGRPPTTGLRMIGARRDWGSAGLGLPLATADNIRGETGIFFNALETNETVREQVNAVNQNAVKAALFQQAANLTDSQLEHALKFALVGPNICVLLVCITVTGDWAPSSPPNVSRLILHQ